MADERKEGGREFNRARTGMERMSVEGREESGANNRCNERDLDIFTEYSKNAFPALP